MYVGLLSSFFPAKINPLGCASALRSASSPVSTTSTNLDDCCSHNQWFLRVVLVYGLLIFEALHLGSSRFRRRPSPCYVYTQFYQPKITRLCIFITKATLPTPSWTRGQVGHLKEDLVRDIASRQLYWLAPATTSRVRRSMQNGRHHNKSRIHLNIVSLNHSV